MSKSPPVSRERRRVLRTVGTTLAAAVAAPSLAARQHAGHGPATAKAFATQAAPTSASAPPAPSVLDEHERATLAALGDQLVPGIAAAGVPLLIDRVLANEPPEVLRQFRNALGAFEREARMRHGRTWLTSSAEQRLSVLQDAAAMPALARRQGWKPGEPVLPNTPAGAPPPPTLRDHMEGLRDMLARAYATTEAGMTELGWTGADVFDGLPACTLVASTTR